MKKIKNFLFPKKTKWIDVGLFDLNGHYKLIQMRKRIDNNKKKFRIVKIGFVNDYVRREVIFENILES